MKHCFKIMMATLLLTAAFLTSCSSKHAGMRADEAYLTSSDALDGAIEYEIITERRVSSTDGLETISQDRATYRRKNGRFYMQNADTSNPLLNMEGWYIDGFSYAAYRSMKIKTPVTLSEYVASNGTAAAYLPRIDESLLKKLKFEGDGERFITLTLSAPQYTELFGESGIGGEIDGEVTYKVYFDADGRVASTLTSFYMTVKETRLYSETKTSFSFTSPDIDLPANAEEFTLIG